MSLDFYVTARTCPECAKTRIKLRKHTLELKLFLASHPLEFVARDLLGELFRTPRGKKFLLIKVDSFSKLIRTLPLRSITSEVTA